MKDIEIVAMPRLRYEPQLMDVVVEVNALDGYPWRSLGHVIKNGPKYKQLRLHQAEINLDLFIVTPPAQWGVIMAIRTGPAEFSQWCVTQRSKGGALPSDCQVKDGGVYRHGASRPISMPEELDFLDFLGLGWINPSERKGRW